MRELEGVNIYFDITFWFRIDPRTPEILILQIYIIVPFCQAISEGERRQRDTDETPPKFQTPPLSHPGTKYHVGDPLTSI